MIKSGKKTEVKLLGVTVNIKHKFDSHIANICFKANQKLIVSSRLAKLSAFGKTRF